MNRKKIWKYLPEILILIICAVLLVGDISQKEGYHMDELLSFELANAQFNPWIVPTQPQGRLAKFVENEIQGENFLETTSNVTDTLLDVAKNRRESKILQYTADVYEEPVWITKQQFQEYLTVNEKDCFNYLSVYFNVKDDNHPPLHFMVLHTVSSIFKGQVNPYIGCCINLACVLAMMVLLMVIGRDIMRICGQENKGRMVGLWTAGLYGLSAGAVSTTLLIRMYGMLSLFCVALLFIHIRKLYSVSLKSTNFETRNIGLILVTLLGFWTQYFFLFYCLILATVTAGILWKQARKREMFCYIRSMVLAGVIGIAVYPFAIGDVLSSERGVEALGNLSSGFAGYGLRLRAFGRILAERVGFGCVIVFVVVMIVGFLMGLRKGDNGRVKGALLWVLVLPVLGYFLLAARMSPHLVDRYIMPIFPMVSLLLVVGVGLFVNQTWILGMTIATFITAVANPIRYQNDYLYRSYSEQISFSENYADTACICIGEGVTYYENLLEFMNYEKTLILTPAEFYQRKDKESIRELPQVVVILKEGQDANSVTRELKTVYGFKRAQVLFGQGGVYDDEILMLQK